MSGKGFFTIFSSAPFFHRNGFFTTFTRTDRPEPKTEEKTGCFRTEKLNKKLKKKGSAAAAADG